MKKHFTILLLFTFVMLFACKDLVEPENGIRATGDYAGFLTKRIVQVPPSTAVSWQISSVIDSSNVIYPTFELSLSEKKGALAVRTEANKPLKYYYAVNHQINVNNANSLEIKDIKFLSGGGISAANEIISPDNTKSVILNGKLTL